MAAPASNTIKDLSGTWVLNKGLSGNLEAALALQGVSWLIRKGIVASSVTLEVKQYVGPPAPPNEDKTAQVTHIDIQQIASAGIKGTTETRNLDFHFREHTDWLFGTVRGQSKWISAEDVAKANEFLAKDWLEGDAEAGGPNGETHVWSHVESVDNGWTATQVWGFQLINDERRYVRNLVVAKGNEKVEFKLVYDFVPPPSSK